MDIEAKPRVSQYKIDNENYADGLKPIRTVGPWSHRVEKVTNRRFILSGHGMPCPYKKIVLAGVITLQVI